MPFSWNCFTGWQHLPKSFRWRVGILLPEVWMLHPDCAFLGLHNPVGRIIPPGRWPASASPVPFTSVSNQGCRQKNLEGPEPSSYPPVLSHSAYDDCSHTFPKAVWSEFAVSECLPIICSTTSTVLSLRTVVYDADGDLNSPEISCIEARTLPNYLFGVPC